MEYILSIDVAAIGDLNTITVFHRNQDGSIITDDVIHCSPEDVKEWIQSLKECYEPLKIN